MLKFTIKRLFYGLLIIGGIILVVFFLFHAMPGNPVAMMAGHRGDVSEMENIKRDLGLHEPLPMQLVLYINDLSPVSIHQDKTENKLKYSYNKLFSVGEDKVVVLKRPYMRRSFQTQKRVDEIIAENIASTFWLALAAMVIATSFGIGFGIIASLKHNTFWDHFLASISTLGISTPSFVSAIFIALIFGYYLSDYTGLNLTGQLWVNHPVYGRQLHLENLILPSIALGIRPMSIIMQLTRNSMLDVLKKDYIRTAKAKGLRNKAIIGKHALKNSLNPVITAVSGWMASLMAGAFFVEYVFEWKGLGFVTLRAVQNLDFPVVMGATIVVATIFIFINIFVDILYAIIDPRVRVEN